MDLSYSSDEEAFRQEVRAWLDANLPAEWRQAVTGVYRQMLEAEIRREWQRRLYQGGWLTLSWPKELGGRGATPVMQAIYQEELTRAGAPVILGQLGVQLLAPVLRVHGSDWQKAAYLDGILAGALTFCQGFSEPNAGSDLASLRTRAERREGGWVLNGQKVWSSGAQYADRSFLLARTEPDAPAHRGIGYFLVDLKQPGVEVRPIVQLTGGGEFCEIFLTDATVDDRDLVGGPTDGWKLAMSTFGFERGGLAYASRFEQAVAGLAELSRELGSAGNEIVRQRIAQARIEAHVFRVNCLRDLTRSLKGDHPGPEASLTKLFWSEMDKRLQEAAVSIQGVYGALHPDSAFAIEQGRWQYGWMWSYAETIYAGTSEIQRNIIAERVLGLPRGR